jgi:lipase maturation factor 1
MICDYRFVKTLRHWIFGCEKPGYQFGARLFCRGMGLIFLIATVSWWVQVDHLIGKRGLVPAQELFDYLTKTNSDSCWQVPSLFWISGASDLAIHLWCAIGCLGAVLAMLGRVPGPALAGCWVIYLSFVTTGDTFMSFQWDILLLEAGILAVLLCGWQLHEPLLASAPLSRRQQMALVLVWLLITKLMFFSGWVKLAWASPAQPEWWPERTALTYHYQTQPLPNVMAWYLHQLPRWFHQASLWPMYLVELGLPFLVFLGARLRSIAAGGFIGLMLLILGSGNFTYFNWLSIVLCLPLIANRHWPARFFAAANPPAPEVGCGWRKWMPLAGTAPIFLLLGLLNFQIIATDLHQAPRPLLKADLSPRWLDSLAAKVAPFHLCAGYGLFRTMTTDRPEIILQGSRDGIIWKNYDFKWKPDELDERPRWVAPHQPRVAWQLWFAALEREYRPRSSNSRWMEAMLVKILQGDATVNGLFRTNPFPTGPPKYLRARLYRFEFTTFAERRQSRNWWKKTAAGDYLPVISLPEVGN